MGLLAPASASADTCPPGTEFTPTYEFVEGRVNVPLVATHELTMVAQFSDRVDHVALSVPDGVRVLGSRGPRMKLIVPVSASMAVTATWMQDDPANPDNPTCTATATTALPITATRPSRAYYLRKAKGTDAYVAFAVVSDPQRGDVSPMQISLRVAASTRFPSARAKARRMPVAMRPSELVHYRKHIPQEEFATTRAALPLLRPDLQPESAARGVGDRAAVSRAHHQAAPSERRIAAVVRAAVPEDRALRGRRGRHRGRPVPEPTEGRARLPGPAIRELVGRARVAFHCGPSGRPTARPSTAAARCARSSAERSRRYRHGDSKRVRRRAVERDSAC